MANLKERRSFYFRNSNQLVLEEGNKRIAELHYSLDAVEKAYTIEWISTHPTCRRQGYAVELLSQLRTTIGPDQIVCANLVHDESWNTLRTSGYTDESYYQGSVIIPTEACNEIPFVQMLARAGFHSFLCEVHADIKALRHIHTPQIVYEHVEAQDAKYTDFFNAILKAQS